ncbi:MAG: hypothetical protein H0V79_04035, partial [Actinobacteria bacterium]|nr:hypothetical protein [Actinomycetota bacterium]
MREPRPDLLARDLLDPRGRPALASLLRKEKTMKNWTDAAAIDATTATIAAEKAIGAARSAVNAPQKAAENAEAARAERIRRELVSEEGSWLGRLMPKRNAWP